MKRHGPDLLVHAGDILECPFSPDPPGETIALLRSERVQAIPGNQERVGYAVLTRTAGNWQVEWYAAEIA